MSVRPKVLMVDDDPNLLSAFRRTLRNDIDLAVATSAEAGLKALSESGPFDVVVSDHNMPGVSGARFLGQVATAEPFVTRIMLTGADDQGAAIEAVNTGQIFRFLRKPCANEELLRAIREGARQHQLLIAERELLEKTLSGSVKVLTDVLSLLNPRAFESANIVKRFSATLAQAAGLESRWELDLAAMIWPLGDITLPPEILMKRNTAAPLTREEQELAEQTPLFARTLIANIPRLQGVADGVYYSRKNFDGSGFPKDAVSGEKIPIVARILRLALDAAEIARRDGALTPRAADELRRRTGIYDPRLIAALPELCAQWGDAAPIKGQTLNLPLAQLAEGDRLVRDVNGVDGRLLLAAGEELSAPMIIKLRQIHQLRRIAEPIHVSRGRDAGQQRAIA